VHLLTPIQPHSGQIIQVDRPPKAVRLCGRPVDVSQRSFGDCQSMDLVAGGRSARGSRLGQASGNESAAANTGFAHETHFGVTDGVLESREHR
jgi:hypothetical protein